MKNLLLFLFLIPTFASSQLNYQKIDTDVHNMWEVSIPESYWKHYESRQLMYSGIAFTGMTGLALHFNTMGDGPYIPFAMVFGAAAVGKFVHAGIVRKREKGYDEWGRRLR